MAPPTQVAAPPKGSISVGWLWVSFLKSRSQSSLPASVLTLILTVQALIYSDSSSRGIFPCFFRYLATMVPMSMRFTGLVRFRRLRVFR